MGFTNEKASVNTTSTLSANSLIKLTNNAEGNTGALSFKTAREVHTLDGVTTSDTSFNVPAGSMLLGVSMNVNTAVTDDDGDDTWSSAFITGSTTSISTASAATKDTKVNLLIVPAIATDVVNVRFTPQGTNFTAGVIEVVVYYAQLTALANA